MSLFLPFTHVRVSNMWNAREYLLSLGEQWINLDAHPYYLGRIRRIVGDIDSVTEMSSIFPDAGPAKLASLQVRKLNSCMTELILLINDSKQLSANVGRPYHEEVHSLEPVCGCGNQRCTVCIRLHGRRNILVGWFNKQPIRLPDELLSVDDKYNDTNPVYDGYVILGVDNAADYSNGSSAWADGEAYFTSAEHGQIVLNVGLRPGDNAWHVTSARKAGRPDGWVYTDIAGLDDARVVDEQDAEIQRIANEQAEQAASELPEYTRVSDLQEQVIIMPHAAELGGAIRADVLERIMYPDGNEYGEAHVLDTGDDGDRAIVWLQVARKPGHRFWELLDLERVQVISELKYMDIAEVLEDAGRTGNFQEAFDKIDIDTLLQ